MMNLELVFLLMAMVMVFTLGNEYGQDKINKLNKRKDTRRKREELKATGLQSIPFNHIEELEVNFVDDIYGHKEFKLATLIVTSPSGARFVVDKDLRGNSGSPMELTSFANKPADSLKSYLLNIDVIDTISKHVKHDVSTDIERYYAFQKTIDDIYRGKHWLTKADIASIEIRFFDLTYAELRTIAEPEQAIFYFDTVKNPTKITKTEELFNKVNETIAAAEVAFARYDEIVANGRQVVEDIIADTLDHIKTLSLNTQESLLAYAYASPSTDSSNDDHIITEEEWKDIKSFTVETRDAKENKQSSITLKAIKAVIDNAKSYIKYKDVIEYDIMDDADDVPFYKHNRTQYQTKKTKNRKNKNKQRLSY